MGISKIEKHQILFSFSALLLAVFMDLGWFYLYTIVTRSILSFLLSVIYWIVILPFLLFLFYALLDMLGSFYQHSKNSGLEERGLYLTLTPIISIFFAKNLSDIFQNPHFIYLSIIIFPIIYLFYTRAKIFSRFFIMHF